MESCIVYGLLGLIITLLTNEIKLRKCSIWLYAFPVFLYTIVVGCRFETGTDWIEYKGIFEGVLTNTTFSFEFGFRAVNYLLAYLGFNYISIFIIFAFFQILLIYRGFYKNNISSAIVLGVLAYFLCGPFLSSMNIMRQSLVFCIFFNAIPLITRRKFKLYFIVVLLMISIHTSSVILLPLYYLGSPKLTISHRKIITLCFIGSLLIGNVVFIRIADYFFSVVNLEQFSRYALNYEDNKFEYGLGVWLFRVIDLGLIWYAVKLNKSGNQNITVIYWIFVIGSIISNLAIGNQLVIRLSYCFVSFRFVLLAMLTLSLIRSVRIKFNIEKLFVFGCWGLSFLAFFISILKNNNGINPYQSIFQFLI